MAELEPGATFAAYRIVRVLGRGGMGIVYEAIEQALDRRVALKVIAAEAATDPVFLERFREESRIAAQVDHLNVIPIYAIGESDRTPFIAMRYVPGRDLASKIESLRRLEPADAAGLIAQVGAGLDAIHAAGLVHRDVKPANILLAGEEGREHAYITDFGLAKHVASTSAWTSAGMIVGTVDYVSPEQIEQRPVDARADVYGLGCVLYEVLTGEPPFPAEDGRAKMWAHAEREPPAPSRTAGVPVAFDAVIARALAKRPEDRYPSAGDLGRASLAAAAGAAPEEGERAVARGGAALAPAMVLEEEEGSTADLARRYAKQERAARRRRRAGSLRRRLVPALVAGLFGLAAGIAIFLVLRGSGSEQSAAQKRLIGRADEICTESRALFNLAAPDRTVSLREASQRAARQAVIAEDALRQLRELPVPDEVEGQWSQYLGLRQAQIEQLRAARDAARGGDLDRYRRHVEAAAAGQPRRFREARQIGLRQCSRGA